MSTPALATPPVEALLRQIRGVELRVNRLLEGGLAGTYRSVFRGRGIEAEGLREYTFADDAALIDWQASSRTQRPHVRVYREERELVCLLLVDASASMRCPVPAPPARRAATEIAALLALAAVHNRDRVGLLLFSTQTELWLAPTRSRAHALRLVREVAGYPPGARGTDIGQALRVAARLAPPRSLIFLVSDMVTEVPTTDVARLARHHDLIVLHLRHRQLDGLPQASALWVADAESGGCLPIGPSGTTLATYQAALRRTTAAAQTAVEQGGGEWVDIPNAGDALAALARYLKRRVHGARRSGVPREAAG